MQQAQALSSLTLNFAELIGPAIATALVLGVGAGWAFLLDAATFVVSATLLLRVRTAGHRARRRRSADASSCELSEGFREVSSRPWLWVTVVVFSLAVPLGYAPLFVLGPTIARETYDSAAVFGVVTAAYGAGALAGALIGLRWRPRHPMRTAFLVIAVWPFDDRVVRDRARRWRWCCRCRSRPGRASRCSRCSGTPRWRSGSRRTRCRARAPGNGWARSPCSRSATCWPGPAAEATSPKTVMVTGAILTAVALAVGLLPRDTRMLRRVEHGSHV